MRRVQLWAVGLVSVLGLAAPAPAQTVENPQYQLWAVWGEGASATQKTESATVGGVQTAMTQTQTVKRVTADKVVIEITTVTQAAGQTIKAPPVTFDIPARGPKVDAVPTEAPNDAPKDVPKFKETKGRETLTLNGKRLDCEWTQLEVEGGFVTKTWVCNDVPGQAVKMVSSSPYGKTTTLLVDWKGTKR
jgi:hypothetical protein